MHRHGLGALRRARWREVAGFDFRDITYHRAVDQGTVRIAFDRPEVRNAFRPQTVDELYRALDHARHDAATSAACCSPATDHRRGTAAGRSAPAATSASAGGTGTATPRARRADSIDPARTGRLHILEVQRLIRFMPKVVICVVPGWAAGGGHSLHVVCDLTIASREHARFKQTDADVASFDGGFGSAYLARRSARSRAREIFFLGLEYSAERRAPDGHGERRRRPTPTSRRPRSSGPRRINGKSPTAQRMLKFAFNLIDDGLVGQQLFAGEATRLAYMTDEAAEGRDSFLEKRPPDWSPFPWHFRRCPGVSTVDRRVVEPRRLVRERSWKVRAG